MEMLPEVDQSAFSADLQHFYQFLQSEKQFSPHTVKSYQRDIKRFMMFCDDQSVANWDAIDEQHIRQLVSKVHRPGLGGNIIQRFLSALRRLFRFLQTNQRIRNNPAAHVRAPKSEHK